MTGTNSLEIKQNIHKEILKECHSPLNNVMSDYFPVIAMYYAKHSHEESEVGLHIDPSMTLESHEHLGIWIPLLLDENDSASMYFLTGTHPITPVYQSITIPSPFSQIEKEVKPIMDCVSLKTGEALIFRNNLLHYTPKNASGKHRIAVIIKVIDKEAPLISAYFSRSTENSEIELYDLPKDSYLTLPMNESEIPLNGKKIGSIYNPKANFSLQDVEQIKQYVRRFH